MSDADATHRFRILFAPKMSDNMLDNAPSLAFHRATRMAPSNGRLMWRTAPTGVYAVLPTAARSF